MTSPATIETRSGTKRLVRSSVKHNYFGAIPKYTGELWTARQRQMHSLHYILSYRASFKPELPAWFIGRLSGPGGIVLDPFAGRGTTALQANLMGRIAWSADINPLSERIITPKTNPVILSEIERRLRLVDWQRASRNGIDLSMFYHPRTEMEIRALREHLCVQREPVDRFIELVALSRLHGHSPGFFSVYSFPQISIPQDAQRRINDKRRQKPGYRRVPELILRKALRSLRDGRIDEIAEIGRHNRTVVADARKLGAFPERSVDLVITSPPFLDKADYITDNWLEFWFCGIEPEPFREDLLITPDLRVWRRFISDSFREIHRVLKPGRRAVIEVGEVVIGGELVHLEEELIDIAAELYREGIRLVPERVYIHRQRFTKLANCFRVANNVKGTNTHRLVVFVRE
jgi:hypothetical protein